jgi:polar amino acid transport system substrate-binding protein
MLCWRRNAREAAVAVTPGGTRADFATWLAARTRRAAGALLLAGLAVPAWAAPYRFVTGEYPPYIYQRDGQLTGAAVDIIREVFRTLGKDVSFEIYPWARSMQMFQAGEVDAIFSYFRTPEREAYTHYSRQALFSQPITLWVPRASRLESPAPLAKLPVLTIGVVHMISYGTTFDEAVRRGALRTEVSYTPESCINNLLAGRYDAWVSNHYGAVYSLRKAGRLEEVRELLPPLQEAPAYVGFSRARDLGALRDAFDRGLAQLKESGKYHQILDSYLESMK